MNFPYSGHWGSAVLAHTDWSSTLSAYGDGQESADLLRGDLNSPALLNHLCSAVVHQETLFPVAEPVVRFLLPFCVEGLVLNAFWSEWLRAIDAVQVEYPVTAAMVSGALQTIVNLRAEEGDDALESLFDDFSKGSPASVLTNYTYQQGEKVRPFVERLLAHEKA